MKTQLYDSRLKRIASNGMKDEAYSIQSQILCLQSLANGLFKEVDELEAKLKEARK